MLIDMVRKNPFLVDQPKLRERFLSAEDRLLLAHSLRQAVPINADNVIEYYYAQSDKEFWAISDFPCILPSFKDCWVEAVHPSGILSGEEFLPWHSTGPHRWGLLLRRVPKEDIDIDGQYGGPVSDIPVPDDGWLVQGLLFEQRTKQEDMAHGPYYFLEMPVGKNGAPQVEAPFAHGTFYKLPPKDEEHMLGGCVELVKPLLMAISLMHCKNVVIKDVEHPPKLQRARQKRGKSPLVNYKVLDIKPFHEMVRRKTGRSDTGPGKAIHIMRGHFKTYTPEKPLMGRHVGTYFWESHVRGKKERGVVVKDYSVEAPEKKTLAE